MDKLIFSQIAFKIIDNIEGGYYNPQWHYISAMGKSGETMFGLDRKWGGALNTGPDGKKFWQIIDGAKNQSTWFHGYFGGEYKTILKQKMADIMYPLYISLSKLLDKGLLQIVNSDERLLFHFIYASWNGSGFFTYYANRLNALYRKGITNPTILWEDCLKARKGSAYKVIRQSADKIEKMYKNYDFANAIELPEFIVHPKKKNSLILTILGIGIIAYAIKKYYKQ